MRRVCLASLSLLLLAGLPSISEAGPNAGGVLVVHATTIVYTADPSGYAGDSGVACGQDGPAPPGVQQCPPYDPIDGAIPCSPSAANPTSTMPAGVPHVWYVMAAFPENSCPRLKGVSFRVDYERTRMVILAQGPASGTFEVTLDSDLDGQPFPASGSGTGVAFDTVRTSLLQEVYWFAGYAYGCAGGAVFSLRAKDREDHAFVDDSQPPLQDYIAGFGDLGLGGAIGFYPFPLPEPDYRPCCLPDGSCEYLEEWDCSSRNGTVRRGWTCRAGLCSPLPPTNAISVGSAAGATGTTVTVPLYLTNSIAVSTIRFDLDFDPEVATRVGGSTTPRAAGFTFAAQALDSGLAHVELLPTDDFTLPPGTGSIADLAFRLVGVSGASTALRLHNVEGADSAGCGVTPASTNGLLTIEPPSPPVGACCSPDGTCAITARSECADTWTEGTISCLPNPCPQPPPVGACCAPAGSCTVSAQALCTAPNAWQGAATVCAPQVCPRPMGACCTRAGTCAMTTQETCALPDAWQGPDIPCAPDLCVPTGACCSPTSACAVTTQAACPAPAAWRGANTVCETDPCPFGLWAPNPYRAGQPIVLRTDGLREIAPAGSAVLYNVRGSIVRSLSLQPVGAGRWLLSWDGRTTTTASAGTGVYYLRVVMGPREYHQKILYLEQGRP